MTGRASFRDWLPIGGLALALISILAGLYVRSLSHDTSGYFENVVLVRQLKQMDARWELDVMKSKMGISANYDALVDPLANLTQLQDSLRAQLAREHHEDAAQLVAAEDALAAAVQKKIRLIERFKSHNSVLHNSLFFLPTAANDLRNTGHAQIAAAVDAALLNSLIYSQSPSSDAASSLELQLARLSAASRILPLAAQNGISIFTAHARTVLREQPLVNDLLRKIATVPTTAQIENLDRILSGEQKRTEQQNRQDRQYLLIFAAALVGLFLYAAVKLLRSHAIIQRVNRALHESNTGLELRVEARTSELRGANAALTTTQAAMRNLLDNADQGFLTITEDLLVGAQSSAACKDILGETPGGKPIVELLCRELSQDAAPAMRVTLQSIFRDSSDYIRELKLGLLPAEFGLKEKSIKATYKFLGDSGQLMLILTDMTETRRLTEEVERERLRLEKVVLALTESEAFFALVEDYRDFLTVELPRLLRDIAAPDGVGELYRRLHTYKGLLAQFSFHRSPQDLHTFETRLSEKNAWTASDARTAMPPQMLTAALEADLESLVDILGPDFATAGPRLALPQGLLQTMKLTATDALQEGTVISSSVRQLLQILAGLGGLDLKSALALHGRGAVALAARLEKQLAPVQIEGETASLPSEQYGPFLRSLVHVFRNAADHGIETPEERMQADKAEEGCIRCIISRHGEALEITIEDDGRGVNRSLLENKLIGMGVAPQKARNMPLEELVFREGVSSRDSANEISGRGIGLAAVKTELERVGGSVTVESGANTGTRFRFHLPVKPQESGRNSVLLEKMIP